MLRLLAFIPLVAVTVLSVGASALTGRSDVLEIALPAATPVIVMMTVLGWHMARGAPISDVSKAHSVPAGELPPGTGGQRPQPSVVAFAE